MTPVFLGPHARTQVEKRIFGENFTLKWNTVYISDKLLCVNVDYEFNMAISYIMQLLTQDYGI